MAGCEWDIANASAPVCNSSAKQRSIKTNQTNIKTPRWGCYRTLDNFELVMIKCLTDPPPENKKHKLPLVDDAKNRTDRKFKGDEVKASTDAFSARPPKKYVKKNKPFFSDYFAEMMRISFQRNTGS